MNRWLAEHLFWPATERMLGRDTMRRFRELQRTQHASAEQLRRLQEHKLRRLLRSAAEHCPFYKRRFSRASLDVNDPQLSLDDLGRLTPLTREQIRAHLEEIVWHACPGGAKLYHTGGSSGEPLKFYVDRFRNAADAAARLRARAWWSIRPGDPEILLWGAPIELHANDRLRQSRDALLNQSILSAFDMTAESMDAYLQAIRSRRPVCLYGYASSLALLARHARQRGWHLPSSARLRAVFVTGEVLLEHDRKAIRSAFGVPVVNEYGSRDGGLIAFACQAGNLHVQAENIIVELLDPDGRPVAPGEVGEVTVTHLEAFAMPLIRYRVGDLARLATGDSPGRGGVCACSLASPALAEVRGRVTDQILCRDGNRLRRMHALSLIYVLREADGLTQFRITQPSLDRLDVAVVANERFTPQVQCTVEQRLRQRMGDNVAIEIRRCDHIAATPSGKHACVISHVKTGSVTTGPG